MGEHSPFSTQTQTGDHDDHDDHDDNPNWLINDYDDFDDKNYDDDDDANNDREFYLDAHQDGRTGQGH